MAAYYNEIDPYAAEWLRNLIAAGHIAAGDVDERSILDVRTDDLRGYAQCHLFAGIGVWSHALRLAGVPDDRPVWTMSAPCQPFSVAGKQAADADERHLWPEGLRLIRERRPAVIFGEQVSAAIRIGWLDDVFASLEEMHYACGAIDFPASSAGAPHIRQRTYFVAALGVVDAERAGLERLARDGDLGDESRRERSLPSRPTAEAGALVVGLADNDERGRAQLSASRVHDHRASGDDAYGRGEPSAVGGFWRNAEWLACIDGKHRPAQPGVCPLAHGVAARVDKLRAAGNSIVAPQAAEFIRAAMT